MCSPSQLQEGSTDIAISAHNTYIWQYDNSTTETEQQLQQQKQLAAAAAAAAATATLPLAKAIAARFNMVVTLLHAKTRLQQQIMNEEER